MRVSRAAVAGALVAGLVLVPGSPAHAETVDCLSTDPEAPIPSSSTDRSLPLDALGMSEVEDWLDTRAAGRRDRPGAGVRVAVLDSGVAPRAVQAGIPVVRQVSFTRGGAVVDDAHGTAVAGLIAGPPRQGTGGEDLPVGIAPGAEIVDVKVYDAAQPDEGQDGVEPANLVAGLNWVADNARALRIGVVNVSLAVGEYPPLTRALRRLAAADVVVVAASGNRPEEGDPLYAEFGLEEGQDAPPPGQDAAGQVWPAAYPRVLAVSSTADGSGAPDATDVVLQNSDIDVAVPAFGAISYGLDGGTCGLPSIYTSWAAAEVSGIVAVLRSAFDERAPQIVARLVATASGTPDTAATRNVQTGAGVVQPYEALVRPLRPSKDGELRRSTSDDRDVERATAPPEEVDLLAGASDRALWWGLVAGGALLLALVLRPVLARRRS
ncbi:S8 family serine peptidase [Nocardioides sp. Arc9.136]|uniref:S8 family serine peptidase n=1 Tax=Nocardioides sp. Arc9.136 TaxID=2996826 RepID=UPI0026667153|nr:S8 family serine peptidase [Nocardioides sp. Arc9.136]WKN48793.1 S8 family serine peptidase [Nocardioides sp. Arc9.136]